MFNRWVLSGEREAGTDKSYRDYIKLFLRWLNQEFPNVHYWVQLRLEHVQLYAKYLGSDKRTKVKGEKKRRLAKLTSRDSYRLYTYPIRACSRWAARNFEEVCRDFAGGFEWSKVKIISEASESDQNSTIFIPIRKAMDWIGHMVKSGVPMGVVASVTLQTILGMRETEVLRVFWEQHLFLDERRVRYTAKAKNKYGLRDLPFGDFVFEVLSLVPEKTGKLVEGYWDVNYWKYSREVKRLLHEWDSEYDDLPCSDLRNTLITTAYHQGWGGTIFERFVGHKGNVDHMRRIDPNLDISLDHYVGREVGFGSERDFLFAKFQEMVLPKIEMNLLGPDGGVQNSTEIATRRHLAEVLQLRSVS